MARHQRIVSDNLWVCLSPKLGCCPCSQRVVVSLQEIVNEVNKMKRLFPRIFYPYLPRLKPPLQVTNSKGMSDNGSLLLTLQRITTSFGKVIIKELENGSCRAAYWQFGNRQDRYCGFMANVRFPTAQHVACIVDLLILQRVQEKAHCCM